MALDIAVSIRPLALIAEPLLREGDSLKLLVPAGASPHSYALKMSDRRSLDEADLVVWVGPELERFLQKPLAAVSPERQLRLIELAQLSWPEEDGAQPNAHADTDAEHLERGHHHVERDPHLWLDPRNTQQIATAISTRLQQLQPQYASEYARRLDEFSAQLSELDQSLMARLAPLQERGFAVFHRGYDHFVNRYHLNQLDFIALTPEQQRGAKHIYQLQQQLAGRAQCVFGEFNSADRQAQQLARAAELKFARLDPLGNRAESYTALLEAMATEFEKCLGPAN